MLAVSPHTLFAVPPFLVITTQLCMRLELGLDFRTFPTSCQDGLRCPVPGFPPVHTSCSLTCPFASHSKCLLGCRVSELQSYHVGGHSLLKLFCCFDKTLWLKSTWQERAYLRFHLLVASLSPREIKAETQGGRQAKIVEECYLLACSSVRTEVFLTQLLGPRT